MPLLDLAQRQHDNWIPMAAIEAIAQRLEMAEIRSAGWQHFIQCST